MTLHVDVFFLKENGQLRKKFYFTAVYKCEQGLIDSLFLAEVVLPKVRDDFPAVRYLYAKSDNASSYLETMLKHCTIYAKQNSFILNGTTITNLNMKKINVIEKLQEQNVL